MVRAEPLSGAWAEALAEGEETFSERFGIPVVDGWAVFPEALPGALRAASGDGDRWGTHLFFDDDGALVGWGVGRAHLSRESPSSVTPWPRPGGVGASPPMSSVK